MALMTKKKKIIDPKRIETIDPLCISNLYQTRHKLGIRCKNGSRHVNGYNTNSFRYVASTHLSQLQRQILKNVISLAFIRQMFIIHSFVFKLTAC